MREKAQHRDWGGKKPCISCGEAKCAEAFYWYPYVTAQGKESKRRESRCKDCARARRMVRYHENPARDQLVSLAWKRRNTTRVKAYQASKQCLPKTKALKCAAQRRRDAKYRTPAWADLNRIRIVYEVAAQMRKDLGVDLHVDHILPLQGSRVLGLHVHENLQIIPAAMNHQKKNKLEVV